jgi:nitrite reductase/ring-hydroxylating ferredoxin subunit
MEGSGDADRFAAHVSQIERGQCLSVELEGHDILICHAPEGFFAVDNNCSHADQRLDEGRLRGHRLLCPLHGAAFDVRDGRALSRPALRPISSYPVRLEGDDIFVDVAGGGVGGEGEG